MPTRNGKIANLPADIRQQLNLRLLEGETGAKLAAWLNALPESQSVLDSQFNGAPISEVNLTHWRQGGYLQWLTERECFDSARALAEGDCDLATTGLTAERLLNILTLRYGELLMRWDFSPVEGVHDSAAFAEVARKARILQGISRSVLAIHRIQSQSACSKPGRKTSSPDSAQASVPVASAAKSGIPSRQPIGPKSVEHVTMAEILNTPLRAQPTGTVLDTKSKSAIRNPLRRAQGLEPLGELGALSLSKWLVETAHSEIPKILSGPVFPSSVPLNLSQTPFKFDADLAEVLTAV